MFGSYSWGNNNTPIIRYVRSSGGYKKRWLNMNSNLENIAISFEKGNMAYFDEKLPIPMFDLLHSFRTYGYFHSDYK